MLRAWFDGCRFGACGRSTGAAERNPKPSLRQILQERRVQEHSNSISTGSKSSNSSALAISCEDKFRVIQSSPPHRTAPPAVPPLLLGGFHVPAVVSRHTAQPAHVMKMPMHETVERKP
ncbi:hypothetical protein Vretimale_3553 [Volvox reticuliferus]|uniref:Uncharacterized protein n=1 Tax=Volvox reticuliferus TaxID=1737510 RepID=A0A8J4D8Z0_9CHLO|nr:hypothetical protein Vretifemale_1166 [Volvox reticuliferus]GIL98139.1 hypothetical protein Vretimale_3553 [Volvox reticuliferus]